MLWHNSSEHKLSWHDLSWYIWAQLLWSTAIFIQSLNASIFTITITMHCSMIDFAINWLKIYQAKKKNTFSPFNEYLLPCKLSSSLPEAVLWYIYIDTERNVNRSGTARHMINFLYGCQISWKEELKDFISVTDTNKKCCNRTRHSCQLSTFVVLFIHMTVISVIPFWPNEVANLLPVLIPLYKQYFRVVVYSSIPCRSRGLHGFLGCQVEV